MIGLVRPVRLSFCQPVRMRNAVDGPPDVFSTDSMTEQEG